MRVAKELRFEAAHRIPWHEGACRHLHGHSYGLTVTLEGEPDERGMVIDFREIKALLAELVAAVDHSVLVSEHDTELMAAVESLGGHICVLPYDSTAENLCRYVADYLLEKGSDTLRARGITNISVQVRETASCYAELTVSVTAPSLIDVAPDGRGVSRG